MGRRARLKFKQHPRVPALPDTFWPSQAQASDSTLDWSHALADRAAFEAFASRDDVPGMLGVREVKFLITNADTDAPQLYFMNSKRNPLHYNFARNVLKIGLDAASFNRATYFTDHRQFLAGTIIAYDNYLRPDGSPGVYAMEFWPTDPVPTPYVAQTYHLIKQAMGFAAETLAYHPSGDIQENWMEQDEEMFAAKSVRTISTAEIFEGVAYSPLNLGEAIGTLRLITPDDPRPPAVTDIVIYETLPNDLPLVAGVISSAPQTPLSHVNLRAQQNNIANAYLRNAAQDPVLKHLIGKPIRMVVTADRIGASAVTTADLLVALEARRPKYTQKPPRDLMPKDIVALDDLAWEDVKAFGAKSTNLAELRRAIDPTFVPNGFAVPFSFYHDFMTSNGFYAALGAMISAPDFQEDTKRPDLLKAFRRTLNDAPLPAHLSAKLDAMHQSFPAGTTPRCRSSANNEDLIGFTGAGLYDSYTHREDEGRIEKTIKQVWASLWNLRAFDERDFYRIDHMTAAMGVLVHPNFDDEQVNGVALTRNIYFPGFEGYFINAQVGESLVTNPDGTETAEEVLVLQDINNASPYPFEAIYIRRSSLVPTGDAVLSHIDLMTLSSQLRKIQKHFSELYRRGSDKTFAMDVEFKIDANGKLAIKQARPWIG